MAWNYLGNDGEPRRYLCYPEPAFVRVDLPQPRYDPTAPVAFRQPPFYDDGFLLDCRRHAPDVGLPGLVPREQTCVWRGDESAAGPWWCNPEFPNGGHNGHRVLLVDDHGQHHHHHQCEHQHSEQTLELYVPLCCDDCERRVKDFLSNCSGVEGVTADQWEKKVVVVGRNLSQHNLLRRLQRNLHMPRCAFWEHRPR